jgi:hypothetical protein
MSPRKQAAASWSTLARLGYVLRHPRWYAQRFGFGAFQVLFLPALVVGTLVLALCLGHQQ